MSPRAGLPGLAAGLAVSLVVGALSLWPPRILTNVDLALYDLALRRADRAAGPGQPVIVDLDERSLAEYGRWPWPRSRLAGLLARIRDAGARVVALDMMFPEADEPASDAALAGLLRAGPFVVGYAFTFDGEVTGRTGCGLRPVPVVSREGAAGGGAALFQATGAICGAAAVAEAAPAAGFLNATPDGDGTLRRIPVLIEYRGRIYPSLAVAALLTALDARQVLLESARPGGRTLQLGALTAPLDPRGNLLLRFRGGRKRFPYVSAADVLGGRVAPGVLRGRIVLVGTSALGVREVVATPLDPLFPGVEVHATVVDNLLRGAALRRPAAEPVLDLTLILLFGAGAALVLGRARPGAGTASVAAAGLALWAGSGWALGAGGVVVSPLFPSLALVGSFAIVTVLNVARERRRADGGARSLQAAKSLMLHALTSLTEIRDSETGEHLLRTQRYTRLLAGRLAPHPRFRAFLTPDTIELLVSLAPIHDIGKVGVPDRFLRKPGPLDPGELHEMRRHPTYGRDVIEKAQRRVGIRDETLLRLAKEIVYSHHERWDGTGYPERLRGDQIPIAARLIALVDVYDALVSTRVYKDSLPHEQVVETIRAGRGSQFDPDVVDAFLAVEAAWRAIAVELADDLDAAVPPAVQG